MKKLAIVIAASVNMLTICMIVVLSFVRYQIDTLDGEFNTNMYDYIPVMLIVAVVITFCIELYIIIKNKE